MVRELEGLRRWLTLMFPGYPVTQVLRDWELEDLAADLEELGVDLGPDGEPARFPPGSGDSVLTAVEEALKRAELKRAEFHLTGAYPCPTCKGAGRAGGEACETCEGAGRVTVTASLPEILRALGLELPEG